jgi:imidazole glycerol-phosphate synthase subunit HisF
MLKTRVIGVLVIKNGWVVQSIQFKRYLPIGSLKIAVEYLNQWGVDEIVILDIDATNNKSPLNLSIIKSASKFSQTPLSFGGGISSLSDVESLLRVGVDKVVINSQLISNPAFVKESVYQFGSQCIVASVDAISNEGNYNVYSRQTSSTCLTVKDLAKKSEDLGVGEIFLNSVDRDGMKTGFDLKLASEIRQSISIPIILCGGVGKSSDLVEGAKIGVDAVAAGNFFHFTEMSVIAAKQYMVNNGSNVRLDSYATYSNAEFDERTERPTRLNEDILEKLRFNFIPEEKI